MWQRWLMIATAVPVLGSPLWALSPEPLKGNGATLQWSGPQFIQADAHGNVFLLRGDTLEVYPVLKSHELGEPQPLHPTVESGPVLDAAMSRRGDWALLLGYELHLFVDGQEKEALPALPWVPVSVGFLRGDPVALVVPPARPGAAADRQTPPVLLRTGHDSWTPELREALHGAAEDFGHERLYRAALVLDAGEGRYFMARQYAYRIELRRLGLKNALEELRLGKGEPLVSKSPDEDSRRLLVQAKAQGSETRGARMHAFHGQLAVLALTQGGPGGRLYALVGAAAAGDHCALDRIDWEARHVERTLLDLPCDGRMSLAAGRDGLYFADFDGQEKRSFASWAALDASRWTAVKDTEFSP